MNETDKKEIDYQEKDLTNQIKNKAILYFELILMLSLVMLIFTLIWSLF